MPTLSPAELDQKLAQYFDILLQITKAEISSREESNFEGVSQNIYDLYDDALLQDLSNENYVEEDKDKLQATALDMIDFVPFCTDYFLEIYYNVTEKIGHDSLVTERPLSLYETLTKSDSFITLFKQHVIADCQKPRIDCLVGVQLPSPSDELIDAAIAIVQQPALKPAMVLG